MYKGAVAKKARYFLCNAEPQRQKGRSVRAKHKCTVSFHCTHTATFLFFLDRMKTRLNENTFVAQNSSHVGRCGLRTPTVL